MRIPHLAAILLLSACTVSVPPAAQAAQSYDNCAHFIDTVPAVLDKQGVWCMNKDLSTAQASGYAIEIQTNNVTLDCNDFKLGGLAAGDGSQATGIYASGRQNVTVRHCNVRGFMRGIVLEARIVYDDPGSHLVGAGHLVEDNLLDHNLFSGIQVDGVNNLVRRNRVFDTGGSTAIPDESVGIFAAADIVDNIVDGVSTAGTTDKVDGIRFIGEGTTVTGNRVGGLELNGGGAAHGISASDAGAYQTSITGNRVAALDAATPGVGILAVDGAAMLCADNIVTNFTTAYEHCTFVDGTYNASH